LFRATTLQLDLGSGHDKIRSFPVCVGNFAHVLGYRSYSRSLKRTGFFSLSWTKF